jgi:hypothetical protein
MFPVVVLNLCIPETAEEGRCAVVPFAMVNAPVASTVATPESGCKTILPVVSPVVCRAVVVVVPARIVDIFYPYRRT